MSWKDTIANDPTLQTFTATGRPIPHPNISAKGRAMNTLLTADSWGNGAPNLLPVKFSDDSVISVPVMPPRDSGALMSETKVDVDDPIKEVKSRSRLGGFLRRTSGGREGLSGKANGKGSGKEGFVLKKMTRGEYLKHYAKDEEGRFIGTEDPADDCILNREEDRARYRRPLEWTLKVG